MRLEGLGQLKNPKTSSGIESATFRQNQNQIIEQASLEEAIFNWSREVICWNAGRNIGHRD
jgi:hypothetical protein